MQITGTCKSFDRKLGYGFITPNSGGDDVFIHFSEIQMDGDRYLEEGDIVAWIAAKDDEGRSIAKRVQRIGKLLKLRSEIVLRGMEAKFTDLPIEPIDASLKALVEEYETLAFWFLPEKCETANGQALTFQIEGILERCLQSASMAPGFHEDEITGVRMYRAPGGGGNENKIWLFHPEHKHHKGDELRGCDSHEIPDCGGMLRVYPKAGGGHNLSHPGFWNCYDLVDKSRMRTTNNNGTSVNEDICQDCFDLHAFRRLEDETEPRTVFRFTGFGEKTEDELMELFFTIVQEGILNMVSEEDYAKNASQFDEAIREQVATLMVGPILDARVKSAGASNDPQWQRRVTSIMEAFRVPAIAPQIFPSNTNTSWRRAPWY